MTDEHDNHGSTPAAWTLVVLVMLGFLIASIAFVAASETWVFVGVGVVILGLVVGKVMQMMASGSPGASGDERSETGTGHPA